METHGFSGRIGAVGIRAALVVGLCLVLMLIVRSPAKELPQIVKGDDALSVAFGDARVVLAQMMIRKSDSYFHGGIDIDCSCHECEGGHHHEHAHETAKSLDVWKWINEHVRAPQQHVHLDGARAVELMPWYWAALRADPHDVTAWSTVIYMAIDDLKDDQLAERLIAEAKAGNPQSAAIAFAEGRYLRRHGKGDLAAARKCFERAERLLAQKGSDRWTEDDRVLANLIKAFLDSAK